MKKIVIVLMFLVPMLVSAQIYAPEGLNLPGAWNQLSGTWYNPPTVNALAGIQKTGGTVLPDTGLATRRYTTLISAAASGGDVVGGTYQFLITSGPTSNYYANKWTNITVVMDTIQTYTYSTNTTTNNSITVTNGKWYTFNWYDQGYVSTQAIFMETSAAPVTILAVSDNYSGAGNPVTVNITLSGSKSAEENVFIRYTTDGWTTSKFILATGSGTAYSGTIPGSDVTGTTSNSYYVLTTTLSITTMESLNSTDIDLATISYNTNGGTNFPLPVELTSFTAFAAGNTVELNWNTATEVNNYGFEVQRSVIGVQRSAFSVQRSAFEKIGFVEGHGNSNSPNNYSFTDNNVSYGKYAYRLKQIDTDGKYTYSKIVEVQAGQKPTAFALDQNYPNPFNPTTTITYKIAEQGFVNLKVYNILGQKVLSLVNQQQQPGVYHVRFNGSKLPSGVYIYRLEVKAKNNSFSALKKFVLLK